MSQYAHGWLVRFDSPDLEDDQFIVTTHFVNPVTGSPIFVMFSEQMVSVGSIFSSRITDAGVHVILAIAADTPAGAKAWRMIESGGMGLAIMSTIMVTENNVGSNIRTITQIDMTGVLITPTPTHPGCTVSPADHVLKDTV